MRLILRFHLPYRCRDSGACCTSGWPIPVEATLYRNLEAAMDAGRLATAAGERQDVGPSAPRSSAFVDAELPAEYARLLAVDAHGACVFHDAVDQRCAIHRALGPAAKPLSCRAFPLIVVHDPRGVSISLSHYCPSAVELLFGSAAINLLDVSAPGPRAPVSSESSAEDAAAESMETRMGREHFCASNIARSSGADTEAASIGIAGLGELADRSEDDALEGLDAREALPPVLREGVLVDWESLTRWERHVAAVFDAADSPEAALACLWRTLDLLQTWRMTDGPLVAHIDRVTRSETASVGAGGRSFDDVSLVTAVLSAIPASLRPAGVERPKPDDTVAPDGELALRYARPLCRYLAARAHACWPLHQGAHGLRSQLVYLEAALAVVRRHVATTRDVREALRRADLWLVHLASPTSLASALDSLLPPLPPR